MGSAEKCPEQQRIGDKGQEVSIRRSNCTNGIVRSRGMVYKKCREKEVNVLEMKCLKSLVGVSRMDRVRNEEVHRRAGIEMELASRDQRVLRWFGHLERMDDYRMARRVLMAEVSRGWVRGRARLGWMDGVKVALGNRGMMVEAARQCAKDRKEWRALVHM